MKILEKIKLKNFKRFKTFEISLDPDMNVLVGDNESGKSSILLALELTLGGSRMRVENVSLESLFNADVVAEFIKSEKRFEDLPILSVELYLNEQNDPGLNGKNNSDDRVCDGLRMICEPNDDLSEEIKSILDEEAPNFPFEYYDIKFFTFSGKPYSTYNRPVRHLFIDSAQINNEHATREYVKNLYHANVTGPERNKHQYEYRQQREQFKNAVLTEVNNQLDKYDFVLRTTGKAALEADLTIAEDGITIQNKGKGQQCFIKTEFALKKSESKTEVDILLLEEPENHLSHVNMKRLISKIRERTGKQIFIATHSNMISARLDLRKCVLLNSNNTTPALLDSISPDTAEFFMKAPDNNVLEFVLSRKVILVEGDAEFILTEAFFKRETDKAPEETGTHVISVGGTSFKRYLELAKLLDIKTAVIRDNDGNYQENCVDSYEQFAANNIMVFSEPDDAKRTFEISLYECNKATCDELFGASRRTLSVQEYMLGNKAEAAFALLQKKADEVQPPKYIADAISWIKA